MMIKEATSKLVSRRDLTESEARAVMDEIMSGKTSPVQTAGYLSALAAKGETIEEIVGSALEMRAHALHVDHGMRDVLEIVGTGGDCAGSINISTTASIVLAAGGVKVAKHGNRAASSKSGAADCLEALGVNIRQTPEQCLEQLRSIGICFLFAQGFHSSMRYVGPVRKELGVRTVFNVLGPLTNPAGADLQVMGVYDESLIEPMADVLARLGVRRGMVVYGRDRLDELSISADTAVCEFEGGKRRTYVVTPESVGLRRAEPGAVRGGTPMENAQVALDIFEGRERGAKRDAVLLNAGAGFYIAGKAKTLAEGVAKAAAVIDSGAASIKLDELIRETNREAE